ncbi:unnamed protein product [Gadus morhua 'NCC']
MCVCVCVCVYACACPCECNNVLQRGRGEKTSDKRLGNISPLTALFSVLLVLRTPPPPTYTHTQTGTLQHPIVFLLGVPNFHLIQTGVKRRGLWNVSVGVCPPPPPPNKNKKNTNVVPRVELIAVLVV